MKDVFDRANSQTFIDRINSLKEGTTPLWGKMNAGQMLAHLNVAYQNAIDIKLVTKPSIIKKIFLRSFVKPFVVGEKPYPKNTPTMKEFKMDGQKDFEFERKRLIGNIQKVQQLGAEAFEGKAHNGFGKLSSREWSNLFSKHLEHHLSQFGV